MSWKRLNSQIIQCTSCPRLRLYCQGIARKRKPKFAQFDYWGKPVPGFGGIEAQLWILGLAPGAHGANRTGRMFTGDSSGDWLYSALHRHGFSNQPHSNHPMDGLKLNNTFISAAARCAPPDNKPTPEELKNCSKYLLKEFELLKRKKLFLVLGKIAFDSLFKLLKQKGFELPRPLPKFEHGVLYQVDSYQILASYHPSRQNTNTGVLTPQMWDDIFKKAKTILT